MTRCCHPPSLEIKGTERFFTKQARRYMKQFQKRGLAKEQQYLTEGISSLPLTDKTVLEIGCGVGGLHLTLLKHGASSAIGVDISEGMLEGAKHLSKELGFEQRTTYRLGDFATMNGDIPQVDIVVLDKVVCCYENLDLLLTRSITKTRQVYALSFPKPNVFIRSFFYVPIVVGKILRWSFRPYWHDWDTMIKQIRQHGFKETYSKNTFIWAVRVFSRE